MRTKLSDWKVGENVIFVSSHSVSSKGEDMVIMSVGHKYISIGREGSTHRHFRFMYKNGELCIADGGYSHRMYLPEDYRLMIEYDKALKLAVYGINTEMHGSDKWTEENIQRLNQILELVNAIKA